MKTAIIRDIKFVVALSLFLMPPMAFGTAVESLPPCDYADAEVATNLSLQADFATMSRIEFTLSLVATPSNVVEVSIGTDANADGKLSLDEADQTFGCDCGRWFQRDCVGDAELVADSGPTFAGHGSRIGKTFVLKRRALDPAWNLVKAVRRGFAAIDEVVAVEGKNPGFLLMMR